MKTLFVVSEGRVKLHIGEDYDDILVVPDHIETNSASVEFSKMSQKVKALYFSQKREGAPAPVVECYLDASGVSMAMALDLQVVLKDTDGIEMKLPGAVSKGITDPETLEILRREGIEV